MRICATIAHLSDPVNMVYMLGMEGEFYEMNVHSLKCTLLADLTEELDFPKANGFPGARAVYFKDGYTGFGRVVVADNTYDNRDFTGQHQAGVLGEWAARNGGSLNVRHLWRLPAVATRCRSSPRVGTRPRRFCTRIRKTMTAGRGTGFPRAVTPMTICGRRNGRASGKPSMSAFSWTATAFSTSFRSGLTVTGSWASNPSRTISGCSEISARTGGCW